MIVSHERRFVFIKNRKTAGTSLEVALSPLSGDDAVVTPFISNTSNADNAARNFRGIFNPWPELRRYLTANSFRPKGSGVGLTLRDLRERVVSREHETAATVRDRFGPSLWSSYFTFCFERNPWDKVVSDYWFGRQTGAIGSATSLNDYLETGFLISDWHRYTVNDEIIVDFVGRYEKLDRDFLHVMDCLGVDSAPALPVEKRRVGARAIAANELSAAAVKRVQSVFSHEIASFGYPTQPSEVMK